MPFRKMRKVMVYILGEVYKYTAGYTKKIYYTPGLNSTKTFYGACLLKHTEWVSIIRTLWSGAFLNKSVWKFQTSCVSLQLSEFDICKWYPPLIFNYLSIPEKKCSILKTFRVMKIKIHVKCLQKSKKCVQCIFASTEDRPLFFSGIYR